MHTERHAYAGEMRERVFACSPDQVGPARRWAAAVYAEAGVTPETVEVCCLLVSEVTTNAVVHAGGGEFRVRIHERDLWIEVWDQAPYTLPRHRAADEGAEHGRGLELLDLLAPGYEVVLGCAGKAVRFRPKSD
ncbi:MULTISPECIES: ATP-binding protein [Streptomyces]|uniref:ATP-binding protein n=1 Tax=Streptomyces sudanensis TaxID=436397 RepID=A0ABY4TAY1_9ACTN|nr:MULTISPECIES: ATP-binding protein [Streptomyces]MCP9986808.1 ATP-binding protein [Streptomyces sudanensis]URN15380.1 ATP-binding protein [Streptomyces sudanensis]